MFITNQLKEEENWHKECSNLQKYSKNLTGCLIFTTFALISYRNDEMKLSKPPVWPFLVLLRAHSKRHDEIKKRVLRIVDKTKENWTSTGVEMNKIYEKAKKWKN